MGLRNVFFIMIATQLTGCTTHILSNLVDGPSVCPADVANLTYDNISTMENLRYGTPKRTAKMMFTAPPEKIQQFTLLDGGNIEAHFYRVRQPDVCKYAKRLEYNLSPVFYEDGVFIGYGYDFYNHQIASYKR